MIRNTHPKSVSEIFPNNIDLIYNIPKYQRKYTWWQQEWDLLFNDVIENEEWYFLGSTILVTLPGSAYWPTQLEVIDWQQRMTTLSILLSVIYNKLSEHKDELDDDERTDFNNIRRELAIKDKDWKYYPRLRLQVQDSNQADYNWKLCEFWIIDSWKVAAFAGLRRLSKAFKYFDKLISDFLKEPDDLYWLKGKTDIQTLINLVNRFNKAVMVVIEVDNHKDAYMLFESLNNRWVPLTAVDLIKNLLIAVSDKDWKSEETYEKWLEVVNSLWEEYVVQERFFRQYYNAFRTELNEDFVKWDKKFPLWNMATKTTLMEIYEKIIKNNYQKFLDNIIIAAKEYAIITNKSPDNSVPYKEELKDLEYIQWAPSYILLLYLEHNKKFLNISDSDMKEIIKFLTSFFVRRNVTDTPGTRDLIRIFMNIIELIKSRKDEYIIDIIKNKLISESVTDDVFEKRLKGNMYDYNYDATRFILCYIESQHQTKEIYTDLRWKDKSNKYNRTIEHIFPEWQNIPDTWVDMIAGGDRGLANKYLENYVHKLWNLTITRYNPNLGNLSFEEKKNRKNNWSDVWYNNGLYLNNSVIEEKKRTIEKIENRTEELVKIAMKLFELK